MTTTFIARIVGLAFLAGARPFLTMALAQAVVMFAVHFGFVALHPDYAVLMSWTAVAIVFGFFMG